MFYKQCFCIFCQLHEHIADKFILKNVMFALVMYYAISEFWKILLEPHTDFPNWCGVNQHYHQEQQEMAGFCDICYNKVLLERSAVDTNLICRQNYGGFFIIRLDQPDFTNTEGNSSKLPGLLQLFQVILGY